MVEENGDIDERYTERLREALDRAGMTEDELVKELYRLGDERAADVLGPVCGMWLSTLIAACDVLGVTPLWILGGPK